MQSVVLLCLFVASQALLLPARVFAQTAPSDRCGAEILYDSANSPYLLDVSEGISRPVFTQLVGEGYDVIKPHLSPDGRKLAWVRNSKDPEVGPAIWLFDIATGEQRTLVADVNSDQPAWSPDGMRIAFTSWQRRPEGLIGDIYVIDTDGKNLHRLMDNEFRDEFATWSPDGTHIAFGSNRNGNFDVFVMQSDGSDVQQLTSHPAADFRPSWSPTGEMMVYQVGGATFDESDWEIYVVSVEGGDPRRLTENSVPDAHPDWNKFQSVCR